MSVDRILQGASGTITVTLLAGGEPTDPSPDAATVEVTRADGTILIPSTAAGNSGTGIFSLPYTPEHTALLDTWIATWTFTFDDQQQSRQTRHEVVGGFICSLADLAAVLTGLDDVSLASRRVGVETGLEKALGYACVPRFALECRRARDGRVATRTPLRAVRSLSVNGTAYSQAQLDALHLDSWSICGIWAHGQVTVGYEHGLDFPDADIREAALLLAAEAYGSDAPDGRVIRTEADSMVIQYANPLGGGPFVGARLNQIIQANQFPAIA